MSQNNERIFYDCFKNRIDDFEHSFYNFFEDLLTIKGLYVLKTGDSICGICCGFVEQLYERNGPSYFYPKKGKNLLERILYRACEVVESWNTTSEDKSELSFYDGLTNLIKDCNILDSINSKQISVSNN